MTAIYGPDGKPVAGSAPTGKTVEIVRSASRKYNLGNYESVDFFCSYKSSCDEAEADAVSADAAAWCYEQVLEQVNEVRRKQKEAAHAVAGKKVA